jgi:hypothetical protein
MLPVCVGAWQLSQHDNESPVLGVEPLVQRSQRGDLSGGHAQIRQALRLAPCARGNHLRVDSLARRFSHATPLSWISYEWGRTRVQGVAPTSSLTLTHWRLYLPGEPASCARVRTHSKMTLDRAMWKSDVTMQTFVQPRG